MRTVYTLCLRRANRSRSEEERDKSVTESQRDKIDNEQSSLSFFRSAFPGQITEAKHLSSDSRYMLMRAHLVVVLVLLAVAPCHAGKSIVHDGSTMEKAIPLKQRGPKAVEEEMAWMMKVYRYTPMLATRDALAKQAAEAIRRFKAGQKPSTVPPPQPWEHATLDHAGQVCSYWSFTTPRGTRGVYFDAGVSINIPGEVARQEKYRADYFAKWVQSLKLNI